MKDKWQYFTEKEVEGLHPAFVSKLVSARILCDFPFVITSGYRSPEKNKGAGGVKDSAHTSGLAVDISVLNLRDQVKMAWACGYAGLHRFGSYDRHVHIDDDRTKPFPAFWVGVSK